MSAEKMEQSRIETTGQKCNCLWTLVWLLTGMTARAQAPSLPLLTNFSQVRALTEEQAAARYPVQVQAVATYFGPGRMLFAQDQTEAVYVGYSNQAVAVTAGDLVEIRGVSGPGIFNRCITDADLTVLGHSGRLEPRRVSPEDLIRGQEDCHWVQLTGVVRRAAFGPETLELELVAGGRRLPTTIAEFPRKGTNAFGLIDALVQVQGVCGVLVGTDRQAVGAHLFVPSMETDLLVLDPPRTNAFQPPFMSVSNLALVAATEGPPRRAWIHGTLQAQTNDDVWLRDATGAALVESSSRVWGHPGDNLEAAGFPVSRAGHVVLEDGVVRIMAPSSTNATNPASTLLPMLCRGEELYQLSSLETRRGYPVRLRGVVTYANASRDRVFVQDETRGVAVALVPGSAHIETGDLVEVEGFTALMDKMRVVVEPRWQVLNRNSPLPKPWPASYDDFNAGRAYGQWVQVRGFVHSATNRNDSLGFSLRLNGGELMAELPTTEPPLTEGVGAQVLGVGTVEFDPKQRRNEPYLLVPSRQDVTTIEPASPEPFALPLTPVRDLWQRGNPSWDPFRRVRVKGVVTAQRLGESLYLYDGLDSLFITTAQVTPVQPGDVVEAVGWPAANPLTAEMEDALFRPTGEKRPLPQPRLIGVREALSGSCDATLVQIEGRLLEVNRAPLNGRLTLVLQSEMMFDAVLETTDSQSRLRSLVEASRLRITGVCSVVVDDAGRPKSFFIRLRSPDDVLVVKAAPWWNSQRALQLGAVLAGVVLAALAWGLSLRRGLLRQRQLLREQSRRREALSDLGYLLSSAATPVEVARVIADVADELFGWDAFNMALHSAEKKQTVPVLRIDLIDGQRRDVVAVPQFTDLTPRFQKVLEQGAYLYDPTQPGQTTLPSQPFGNTTRPSACALYAPIRSGSKVTGILSIQSYTPGAYCDEDLQVLQSLADHCAGTLERIRAEDQIQKLANFTRFNPNPVFEFDADGKLTYSNEAAERMAALLQKGNLSEMLPPGVDEIVRTCLATGQSKLRLETQHNGRTISWSFFPIQPSQVVHCYAGDITERLALEAQLLQAQKMECIGRLAGGVAHDFNNLLTVIQGHAGLLSGDPVSRSRVTDSAREIARSADRAAHLTRQLLTFSRKQPMRLAHIDLNEVLSNVSGMLGRLIGEDIALSAEFSSQPCGVKADTGMIQQVLLNLAVNARDAMLNGGQLTLSLHRLQIDETLLEQHREGRTGSFVCLSVIDTGCGMNQKTLHHLFEPFFTTKDVGKGTGLGLATVYGIVQQHQGWVEVASSPGRGSCFKVYLPTAEKPAPAVRTPDPSPPPRGGSESILVVEDEMAVRELVTHVLKQYGYHVLVADSGPAALELWEHDKDHIDLLITDIVMPQGLSGLELAARLHQQKPALKVIYSSGYTMDMNAEQHVAGSQFLSKPYQIRTLVDIVRRCLDGG